VRVWRSATIGTLMTVRWSLSGSSGLRPRTQPRRQQTHRDWPMVAGLTAADYGTGRRRGADTVQAGIRNFRFRASADWRSHAGSTAGPRHALKLAYRSARSPYSERATALQSGTFRFCERAHAAPPPRR